jgi:hypothetical protein
MLFLIIWLSGNVTSNCNIAPEINRDQHFTNSLQKCKYLQGWGYLHRLDCSYRIFPRAHIPTSGEDHLHDYLKEIPYIYNSFQNGLLFNVTLNYSM